MTGKRICHAESELLWLTAQPFRSVEKVYVRSGSSLAWHSTQDPENNQWYTNFTIRHRFPINGLDQRLFLRNSKNTLVVFSIGTRLDQTALIL